MPLDPVLISKIWWDVLAVIYAIVFLFVCYHLKRNPLLRSHIGYSVFIATLAELLALILSRINYFFGPPFYVTFFFDSIGNVFSFLPVIIAFHKICLEQKYENGKYLGYFAYIWSTVIIAAGLLFSVFLANARLMGFTYYFSEKCAIFVYNAYWGFIVLFIGFFGLFASAPRGLKRLRHRDTISIAVYISCLVLRTLVNTVFTNMPSYNRSLVSILTINALVFFLGDIPKVVATVSAALYGHSWTSEFLIKSKCSTSTENKSIQDEPSEPNQKSEHYAARNQRAKPDGVNNQRAKPDAII